MISYFGAEMLSIQVSHIQIKPYTAKYEIYALNQ
jgi:hypothetical protein